MQIQSTNPQQQQEDPQLYKLIEQEIQHIQNDKTSSAIELQDQFHSHSRTNANVYFDKQLTHLVLSEQFNFEKISEILSEAFKDSKIDTSERACRLRWAYIHQNRNNVKKMREMEKEKKREKSVAAFSNPYSLYSVDQLIENLQASQKQKKQKNIQPSKPEQPTPTGYNIFKDSFRKVDNPQEYSQLQQKMQEALQKAQQQPYSEKPLYFTPEYQKLQQFEVKQQELTADKVKQLMAYQIEMEKIGREFQNRREEAEEKRYEEIIRRRIEREQGDKKSSSLSAEIEDNWDDYESD